MTDDSNTDPLDDDERHALVAAYVDGEATAVERARVETDPDLVALADRYRAVKALVTDVPSLTAEQERSILAAAAAEHRVLQSNIRPDTTTGAVAPSRSARTTSTRWLSIAAGLVVVCAGGVFVATRLGDGDSDDSAEVATVADATTPNLARDEGGATEDTAGAGDTLQRQAEEDAASAPPRSVPEAAATTLGETAADLSTGATVHATGQALEVPSQGEMLVLTRADELVRWREDVAGGALVPPGPGTDVCNRRIVGWAEYRPPATSDDTPASMLVVVVQPDANHLSALDPGTCEVVLRADLS